MTDQNTSHGKSSPTLEWAAMFVGVLVVLLTTYLIFGTNWNAFMVLNVILGLGFIVFITYSFVNTKNLKTDLSFHRKRANLLHDELEKSLKRLSEVELEVKEKVLQVQKIRAEAIVLEEKIAGLQDQLALYESQLNLSDSAE